MCLNLLPVWSVTLSVLACYQVCLQFHLCPKQIHCTLPDTSYDTHCLCRLFYYKQLHMEVYLLFFSNCQHIQLSIYEFYISETLSAQIYFFQCDTCWSLFVTTFDMLAVSSFPFIFLIIEKRLKCPQCILRKIC